MGRFAKYAQKVLKDKMAAEQESAEDAARSIQTRCQEKIDEREDAIDEIKRIHGDPPEPAEWQQVIGNEQYYIALEREWSAEFGNPQALLKWSDPNPS